MRSITLISLLAYVSQADAKKLAINRIQNSQEDSTDKLDNSLANDPPDWKHNFIDKLVDRLFDRTRKPIDLYDTILGKPRHLVAPGTSLRTSVPLGQKSLRPRTSLQAHLHHTRSDATALLTTCQLQSNRDVVVGRSSWGGHWPQLRGEATPGHRKQVSAFAIPHHEFSQLAAVKVHDIQAALYLLRDLPYSWLKWYDGQALTFPLITKAMTSGVCFSIGDLCAQGVAGKNISTLDLGRSARNAAVGFVYQGPMAHYFFNFLDKSLSFGGAWWSVVPKMAVDQGPMCIIDCTMYSLLSGVFALRDPSTVWKDVQAALKPGLIASIRFWPIVHFVTFTIVPVELQVLWEDVAEIVWVCILSGVNNEGLRNIQRDGDVIDTPQGADAARTWTLDEADHAWATQGVRASLPSKTMPVVASSSKERKRD